MKKDTFKVLGITFLIVVLLSWIIPAGYYSNGTFTSSGSQVVVGLYDIVRIPVLTIATFIQFGVLFLAIGGLYGVLNKTLVYSKIVDSIAKKYNKKGFMIFTVILFALLTSITGLNNLVFILVPFFMAILLKQGYSKIVSLTSTVGAMLVGVVGTTIGFNVWGYLQYFLSLSMTTYLFARIVILIISVVLLILLLIKNTKEVTEVSKTKKAKEEIKIPLYEENTSKKSVVPFVIISIITLTFIFIGQYNWEYSFKISLFTNIYESINSFEIAGYPIFANLLSGLSTIGYLGNYDVVVILIIASLIIGWLYNVKFKDIFEGFVSGAKEMLPSAIYAMLACSVFALLLNMQDANSHSANFLNTMVNKLVGSTDFSFAGTTLSAGFISFAYNDFYTLLSNYASVFKVFDSNVVAIIALMIQTIYGVVMLVAPTSIYLIAGLTLADVSYKDWIKHIWKYAVILFVVVIVVAFILTMTI